MKLSYYSDVRTKYTTPVINDDVIALGNSPYAGGAKVAPEYAPGILKLITQHNLIKYDESLNVDSSPSISSYDTNVWTNKAKEAFSEKDLILIGSLVAGMFIVLFKK